MVYNPKSTLAAAHDFYAIYDHHALLHGDPSSFFACQLVHREVQRDALLKEKTESFVDDVGVEIVAILKRV